MRTRGRLIAKQTRIKAMVRHFGITFSEEFARRHWSAPFIAWLQELAGHGMQQRSGSLAFGFCYWMSCWHCAAKSLKATRAIRSLSRSDHYRDDVDHLLTIEGIGIISAMTLMTELVDSLASFVGLVPGKHASGDSDPSQSLTNRRCGTTLHPDLRAPCSLRWKRSVRKVPSRSRGTSRCSVPTRVVMRRL